MRSKREYNAVNWQDITKDEFAAYERARQSGATNMYSITMVKQYSGLDWHTIIEIMRHYGDLMIKYPGVRKNPGAAWHSAAASYWEYIARREKDQGKKDVHEARAQEHLLSVTHSRLHGMRNPTKKKSSKLIPLLLIGGIVWLIYKNRKNG